MNTLDELLARIQEIPGEERQALVAETASMNRVWWPNDGPQTEAVLSPADVLLYGGAGGGGKTDCLVGLALTEHRRSLLMRRQYSNLSGLLDRLVEINGGEGVNRSPPPRVTTAGGRIIDLGAANLADDWKAWQGQPHDLLGFDEAAQFLELQVRALMGWVRSAVEGQRCRTVLATNPPMTAEGDWIISMFRPWLDITHPKPAKHGELRWYVTDPDGKDLEVDDATPVQFPGEPKPSIPQSRTFIPAKLADNPFLVNTGYGATLDSLPEPIRSAVRDGNFMLARQDSQWQVIPTDWIRQAQARWTPELPKHAPMSAIAADVAQGGADQTVIAKRYDGWFAPLEATPGIKTPDGPSVAGLIIVGRKNDATIIVDVGGGYGGSACDHLVANDIEVTKYNAANKSVVRTVDGSLGFINKRAETMWRFREALDPSQEGGSPIALPPDPELVADLTSPTFKVTPRGIQVEAKEDIKKRIGRSTDRGDAVVMCWSAGPRLATHGREWRNFRSEHQGGGLKVNMGYANRRRGR